MIAQDIFFAPNAILFILFVSLGMSNLSSLSLNTFAPNQFSISQTSSILAGLLTAAILSLLIQIINFKASFSDFIIELLLIVTLPITYILISHYSAQKLAPIRALGTLLRIILFSCALSCSLGLSYFLIFNAIMFLKPYIALPAVEISVITTFSLYFSILFFLQIRRTKDKRSALQTILWPFVLSLFLLMIPLLYEQFLQSERYERFLHPPQRFQRV